MSTLIVYGSEYGTTRRYAEKSAEITNLPVISYEDLTHEGRPLCRSKNCGTPFGDERKGDCKPSLGYDRIIHFGGLYAGGVKGLKATIGALREDTKLIIVTVGLADVNDKENIENIRKSLSKQVPEKLLSITPIFHLRGGIDYQELSFKHRAMMTLLYNKVKKLPEEKKTAEIKAMIETFNSKVDFVDYNSLDPIVKAI